METETNKLNPSFRQYLQQELMNRCAKNPQYSLRSFAKALGIQAPTLSHMMRGTRKISPMMIKRLSLALGLGPEETLAMISNKDGVPESLMQLTVDNFNLISEWYHFAILELVNSENFQADHKWIARVLGITTSEVNIAVERLIRLGLVEVDEDGQWILQSVNNTTVGHEFTTVAHKKLQKQFLQKATEAIDLIPIELRDQTGMTFSMCIEDMEEVKNRIKAFRRELTNFIERKPVPKDEVYQLSISFFPLSQKTENLKKEINN